MMVLLREHTGARIGPNVLAVRWLFPVQLRLKPTDLARHEHSSV